MRTARRTTLAALTTGLIIALLPAAADACDRGPGPAPAPRATELTLVYVYQKVNPTAPASWENSGEQRLIQVRDGLSWTDSIDVSLLPDDVCGAGWAVQEDQTRGLSRDAVPTVVDRRSGTGVLGWPPIVNARHRDLSRYLAVPGCAPDVPVEPPVTPPVTSPVVTPPVTPPVVTPPVVTPPVVTPPVVTPPVVTPPVVTPPVVTPPATPPATPTVPVVVDGAKAAQPVLAAPSFAG